jgi:hypothetical protein
MTCNLPKITLELDEKVSVELTATRRASTFQMTKTLSLRATLALGGGSSLLSR